jgi:Fic family protein
MTHFWSFCPGRIAPSVARMWCAETLPNSELFVYMYIRKEAVLSSQIEGTQASPMDVLKFEAAREATTRDVGDVFSYVNAMNYGLRRLRTLPLSLRLIRKIHAESQKWQMKPQ